MVYDSKRTDYCTYQGALVIADQIRGYWLAKGSEDVQTDVVSAGAINCTPIFAVRSNLVCGLPPQKRNGHGR